MKSKTGFFAIIALVAVIGFGLLACVGPDVDEEFTPPTEPEAMSGKTAMQFFIDNNIKAGWNLGNTLDAVNNIGSPSIKAEETAWGNPLATRQLFDGVVQSGFDIVRIPCTWIGHIGTAPEYRISEARLARVAQIVGYAKEAGVKAMIINIHHDGNNTSGNNSVWGFVDLPAAENNTARKTEIQSQISAVWTQIAEYFKNYGDYLIFETLNEVHNGNWGSGSNSDPSYQNQQNILFDWNQAALNAIRATGGNNATRYIAVPGLGSTEPDIVAAAHERGKLLPNDGANGTSKLIVSVHYYAPALYTVAGVTDQAFQLIHTWGNQQELEHLAHETESMYSTFISNNIPVYFGEWGAPTDVRSSMSETIRNTHINYISSVAGAARANGIIPIYWDDGGNFKMLERSNGRPKTGFWSNVLSAMMNSINNATPPVIGGGTPGPGPVNPVPPVITGNLGNYSFGLQEDGTTPNYTQARWELSSANVTTAKTTGAKLVLVLESAPTASMQFVWQGPDNEIWWQQTDILGENGEVLDTSHASWNEGTKTLTINMSAADDYSSFASQSSLNLIVAYYGGSNVNALGIVSANLVTE
ncbi:MAG: glycoside hydrolase family 5 protein [Treponema sp.]|nr:glycoside hydrolase family 5 protein [Treponema sp.]MCL2237707.1 glycoside hydrolase family 5 protein [Treponema sp.]